MPIGNLTSQLFSNVYMNPLDQFAKRRLGLKHYIRYADDIIILSSSLSYLDEAKEKISKFLEKELMLLFHPNKILMESWRKGIDVLGFVSCPHKTIIRPKTERRMLLRLSDATEENFEAEFNSLYSRIKFERA